MLTDTNDFRVKKTIGSSWNVDEDDVVKTKTALERTGDYKAPAWGVTGFPDQDMFDGLKSFQKREGLAVDGVMKPGGPTEKRLRRKTKPQSAAAAGPRRAEGRAPESAAGIMPGEWDWLRKRKKSDPTATGRFADPTDWTGVDLTSRLPDETSEIPLEMPGGRKRGPEGKEKRPGETQVAIAPLIPVIAAGGVMAARYGPRAWRGLQNIIRNAPPLIGAAEIARREAEKQGIGSDDFPSPVPQPPRDQASDPNRANMDRANMDRADPPPPTPGFEPPDDDLPNRTESPAEPVELPTLEGRPVNEVLRNDLLVFQAIDEAFRRELSVPLESHRGDEPTQWWNIRVAQKLLPNVLSEWGPDAAADFEHTGGATNINGERLPEKYLRNADVPIGHDGRKGSSNPDITFLHKPTNTELHLNTGLMLKNGKTGIASERRSLARAIKNAGQNLVALLPKFRPGMDIEELDRAAMEVIREQLLKVLGPPT